MNTLDKLLHPTKGILRGLTTKELSHLIPVKGAELAEIVTLLRELKRRRKKDAELKQALLAATVSSVSHKGEHFVRIDVEDAEAASDLVDHLSN